MNIYLDLLSQVLGCNTRPARADRRTHRAARSGVPRRPRSHRRDPRTGQSRGRARPQYSTAEPDQAFPPTGSASACSVRPGPRPQPACPGTPRPRPTGQGRASAELAGNPHHCQGDQVRADLVLAQKPQRGRAEASTAAHIWASSLTSLSIPCSRRPVRREPQMGQGRRGRQPPWSRVRAGRVDDAPELGGGVGEGSRKAIPCLVLREYAYCWKDLVSTRECPPGGPPRGF
jgi:hypothetical protein